MDCHGMLVEDGTVVFVPGVRDHTSRIPTCTAPRMRAALRDKMPICGEGAAGAAWSGESGSDRVGWVWERC
jgi:hypothetical protein